VRRAYLIAIGLVIVVMGTAAYAILSPIVQLKPQSKPVSVEFGVISRNIGAGCLNVNSLPLNLVKLDGIPLNPNSTTAYTGLDNSTRVTLMSGSAHVLSANKTYTGWCSCAECNGGEYITIWFSQWETGGGTIIGQSGPPNDTLQFEVPSNGSSFVAAYASV
jgi:hypothetical protein